MVGAPAFRPGNKRTKVSGLQARENFSLCKPVSTVSVIPPVDDDMVFDVAINGNADAIVTNNTKHFREAARRFGLEVLTPVELLIRSQKRR